MYRTDLINGAMGKQRLTNEQVAEKAGVTTKVVSAVRNGKENIELPSLKKVADALGLSMEELFTPEPETANV
jgi:transcriptional regulator with XRE-family HTH domain